MLYVIKITGFSWVFLGAVLFLFSSAFAQVLTPDFQLKKWSPIDFESYGLKVIEQSSNATSSTVVIEDSMVKESTTMTFFPALRTQRTAHFNAEKKLIHWEERQGNQLTYINYQKSPMSKWVQTFNASGGFLREIYQSTDGREWKKVGEKEIGPKGSMVCNESLSWERYDPAIRQLVDDGRNMLDFELGREFGNYRNIGNNAKTKNCGSYRGVGESALIDDLEASYNQGFACLENLTRAYRQAPDPAVQERAVGLRRIARRIMGNFVSGANKMFTFECTNPVSPRTSVPGRTTPEPANPRDRENHIDEGTHAFAATCEGYFGGESIVPGIQLNNHYFNRASDIDRQSTLFHELLHHAGIYHDAPEGNTDLVYSLQFCCFGINVSSPPEVDSIARSFHCARAMASDHGEAAPSGRQITEVRGMAAE